MLSRNDVISKVADECIKELYSLAQPHIEWEEFKKEFKIYSDKYKVWDQFVHLYYKKKEGTLTEKELKVYSSFKDWEGKNIEECLGPKPYEFYYLPKEVLNEIVESYVYAYKIDSQQELLDTIEILKNYCKEPIVDKYIKKEGEPDYRGYERPDNLEKEIEKILFGRMSEEPGEYREESAKILQDKFFEFLDMAGKFFNWNRDLNAFDTTIYLGVSPCSNKETVIKNWKKYRKQDIEIDESKYKENDDYDE